MASGGRKKTTFAKLARERKLRERREEKQAKKDARKRMSQLDPDGMGNGIPAGDDQQVSDDQHLTGDPQVAGDQQVT